MFITQFLNSRGFYIFEGYSQEVKQQVQDLINLTNKPNINVMEIGFNAGHSAEVFLNNNKNLNLISFDLGEHNYVKTAKEYIDINYPNRHKLILGDSRITVPKYFNDNKEVKFDIIFIDGGHSYEIAKADVENCINLANKDSIIIVDDIYTPDWRFNDAVRKVWDEYLSQNKLIELNRKDYEPGRGMAWGKYIFE
jgi:predicted O-methyltransferase YrrM